MKLYLAAIYSNGLAKDARGNKTLTEGEIKHRNEVRYILESYHYVHKQAKVDMMREDGVKVFLDSGAFSAYFGGVEIDLPAYCEYIKRNQDIIEVASVLDGIGDPLKTWENQQKMEQLGTQPLPCFHYGEDPEYLKWYVEHYDHITLGGMVPISTPQLRLWLDEIWDKYLTKPDGTAKIRVHGFGMTALPLMKRYPWYSVDSSSWVQIANFGNILMPQNNSILSISDQSPTLKHRGKHFYNISPLQREKIKEEIEAAGFDVDRLSEHFVCRWVWNMHAFRTVNDMITEENPTFLRQQETLF